MRESLYYLFLSGLVLGSGPCLGTCAPILMSFAASYRVSIKGALFAYLYFSLAKITAYMLIGALSGFFSGLLRSSSFNLYANAVELIMGVFVLFIGIVTFIFKDPLKSKYCNFLHKGNFRNAGVIGFLTGLSPCLPLIGILNYIIIISRSFLDSIFYSFVFGLGTSVSCLFLLTGLSGKIGELVASNRLSKNLVRFISSIILVGIGFIIIFKALSTFTK
ncbi:MAG: sulfite exporter TauE/SafE family protein [Candidatus Omnitrophota bacterium]